MHYFMSFVACACSYVLIILEASRSVHISPGERDSGSNELGGWMVRGLGLDTVKKRSDFDSSRDRSLSSFQSDSTTGNYQNIFTNIRSRVQKLPAWHTKATPNGKCCEGYVVPYMVRLMYQLKVCWNKGRPCWKIAKLFYFCHLKKLVSPETFGPYYVYVF